MARKRASMREGPLAELFRRTEAAQRAQEAEEASEDVTVEAVPDRRELAALEETVEHVHDFVETPSAPAEPQPQTAPEAEPQRMEPAPEAAAARAAARYFQTILEPAPRLHRVPPPKGAAYIAAIRVVGVGGAGLNAI